MLIRFQKSFVKRFLYNKKERRKNYVIFDKLE